MLSFCFLRTAGLHTFYTKKSNFLDQNHALFVIDLKNHITFAAALPHGLYESLSVKNAQAQQVGNYLYIVGGYGWSEDRNMNITYDVVSADHVTNFLSLFTDAMCYIAVERN